MGASDILPDNPPRRKVRPKTRSMRHGGQEVHEHKKARRQLATNAARPAISQPPCRPLALAVESRSPFRLLQQSLEGEDPAAVLGCAERFGEVREVKREYARESVGKAECFVSHVGGCLSSFAALQGIDDLGAALERMSAVVRGSKVGREFAKRARLRAAKLGRVLEAERDDGEAASE